MWSCWGTLRFVTPAPRLRFGFGKALATVTVVGRLKCSEVLPPPIPLPLLSRFSSCCSVTATPIPHFPSPLLAPYCSPPTVDLRSLYKNPPRVPLSFWPSLMPLGTPSSDPSPESPPYTVLPCHREPLRPPAPLRYAGPYIHFLAQADTRHLSDVIFLSQGFIHSFCSPSRFFVDVAKSSPLLPACFFPFYFLRMYLYVRRIWLGDGRDVQDVRLVSYQRDMGVWMFPGVRRIWFLLAIALKLNAVFVP